MNDNKSKKTTEPKRDVDPELKAIAAEFPEFAEVVTGADFGADDLAVENPDPKMRYYWAAKGDPSRADGVDRVKQLGYRVSEKKHSSVDCVLMETPRDLYDYRMRQQAEANRKKMRTVRRDVEAPAEQGLEVMDHVRSPQGAKPGFGKLHGE